VLAHPVTEPSPKNLLHIHHPPGDSSEMRVAVGEICQVYLHAHQFPARQHCSRIRSCCCLGVSVESSMSKANVDQGPALKRLRPDPGGGAEVQLSGRSRSIQAQHTTARQKLMLML
jgi:hypothetical protein